MRYQSKYFSPAEFNRCTPSCNIEQMDESFLMKLDKLREACGIPLVLNCAHRSVEWDIAKGRSGKSAHTEGKAVDIRCNSDATRMLIVTKALELGFTRIGIEGRFVHIDTSTKLAQNVMWTY